MNKVVTVNLNGRAYQIEEHGYNKLHTYLDQAQNALGDNPDTDEIMADLEQAIAEKCDEKLTETKTVVSNTEIIAIIEQMGPVEGQDDTANATATAVKPVKRLYLIKEGAIVGGVCTGLAAYFRIDVTVMRLIWIIATFFTSGATILAYIVLMVIIPEAKTPEERAAAQGNAFNSQAVVESAKRKYEGLKDEDHWRKVAKDAEPQLRGVGDFLRKAMRIVAGIFAAGGFLILSLLMVLGISATWTIIVDHSIYGQIFFGPDMSMVLTAVLVASLFVLAIVPVFLITLLFYRYAKYGTNKRGVWPFVAAIACFIVALSAMVAIATTTSQYHTIYYYDDGKPILMCDARVCAQDSDWQVQAQQHVTRICVGDCLHTSRFTQGASGSLKQVTW